MTCDMAHNDKLDTGPFESLLRQNKLSGVIAVFSGDYPNLTPEQLQRFKVGRYEKLSVATCVIPSGEPKPPTYRIAAVAYK